MAGAVIGGVASIAGAAMSGSSSGGSGSSREAVEVQREQLAFDKEQYADWKAVYGDIQTNIGNYYKNLTPQKLTALALQEQAKTFQAAKTSIRRELAQKGIDPTSGVAVGIDANAELDNARVRAGIRTNAPQAVIDAKTGFLSLGLGQAQGLLDNIGASSRGVSGALTNKASIQAQQAEAAAERRNEYISAGIDNFTTAVGAYIGGQ